MVTLVDQRKIEEKAKTKNDGVYTYRGIWYKVINKRLRYLASRGEVLECFGNFNVVVGTYDWYSGDARKILKDLS